MRIRELWQNSRRLIHAGFAAATEDGWVMLQNEKQYQLWQTPVKCI